MLPDVYKVEVIHHLNPHLIWVEVCDPSITQNYKFEQVGIYGILPLDKVLDVESEELKIEKCDTWLPAATKVMKDILKESTEVWFSPTHIDKRTTIFDDNIQKFGELIIKYKDDKFKKVSKLLVRTSLAYFNVDEFHQKLSTGSLKTKLSPEKTQQVVADIEKYYIKNNEKKKAVKKQTSVFQISQDFDSSLTITNVEKHNNKIISDILRNKTRDFELCKEIDEESVGCGFKYKSDSKIEPKTKEKKENDCNKLFNDVKHFLDANLNVNNGDSESWEKSEKDKEKPKMSLLSRRKDLFKILKENKNKDEAPESKETNDEQSVPNNIEVPTFDRVDDEVLCVLTEYNKHSGENSKKINVEKSHNEIHTFKSDERFQKGSVPNKSTKHSQKLKMLEASIEEKCIKQIAIGPPGLEFQKFNVKAWSVTTDDLNDVAIDTKKVFEDSKPKLDAIQSEKHTINEYFTKINNAMDNIAKTPVIHKEKKNIKHEETDSSHETSKSSSSDSILKRKIKALQSLSKNFSSSSDTSNKDESITEKNIDFDEDIEEVVKRLNIKHKKKTIKEKEPIKAVTNVIKLKNNVNPFRNVDASISVFVDKLVSPVLMVHSKMNKRLQPVHNMRDIYFNNHIHNVLKIMSIESPMMLQTVSWHIILRGYSLFMISPLNSGKTIGYLPAVCQLISNGALLNEGNGPIAIIVCATAKSVTNVETMAKMFLGLEEKVLACYPGVDDFHMTTTLLNGCDLVISTPSSLIRLLQMTDFGVDLRRLSILVLDDCERLFDVYLNEIKLLQAKVKEMLKKRTNKEVKVQYVLTSRIWFDSMEPLALKAPDTVVCIGAFQECVLYSKTNVSVSFVKSDLKMNVVFEFLGEIDKSTKTVILCKSDDEVELLEKALKSLEHVVFICNNKMTVHDLYSLSASWSEFENPLVGPILVCRDGNLTHMNITDAHNLIHFSLPSLYSLFCKRFSVLNDYYPSIFKYNTNNVKVKVLVEESNEEQLPKIINFIKRCANVPEVLDEVCKNNLMQKDLVKAKKLVPLCDNLLLLGHCPDKFNCQERHTILKDHDTPLEWMPKEGFVTFKILHFHAATLYSGRLLSSIVNGNIIKYPQTFNNLSLKMGMYYCKESNRKLHGIPKVGDICAVCIKINFYVRCQVVKILSNYERGTPNNVLIKLIDEEWFEISRDIYLYHLPSELKSIQTRVAQIRLANLAPKGNDIAFSDLAMNHVKKITEGDEEVFLRGHIALTLGNCIFVDTLEVCQNLKSLDEIVEKHNIKLELLKNHAILNEYHIPFLEKLCVESGLSVKRRSKVTEKQTPEMITKEENTLKTKVVGDNYIKKPVRNKMKGSEPMTNKYLNSFHDIINENDGYSKREMKPEVRNDILTRKSSESDDITKEETLAVETKKDKYSCIEKLNNNDRLAKESNETDEDPNIKNISNVVVPKKIQENECEVVFSNYKGTWASLESNEMICVYLSYVYSPEKLFVRLQESASSMVSLLDDIDLYTDNMVSIQIKDVSINEGELVLAKYPDDSTYERARIESINGENVTCFFLDHGDCMDLPKDHLLPITDEIINKLPFQAIECRLLGVRSHNGEWTEMIKKWLYDYRFNKKNGNLKELFVKYYEKVAVEQNDAYKYGIVLFDTNSEEEIMVNQLIIDLNLAQENVDEMQYLRDFNLNKASSAVSVDSYDENENNKVIAKLDSQTFLRQPIRTVPLVDSDESNDDKWDVNFGQEAIQSLIARDKLSDNSMMKELIPTKHETGKKDKTAISNLMNENNTKQELDSDDLTSPDSTQISNASNKLRIQDDIRRPKILWRQNKSTINVTILIDVENYDLEIDDKSLKFSATLNNAKYEFSYELYGVIDKEKSSHVKKGLCVSVKLVKILQKNWLTLTREGIKHGISYDVSTIDISDEDEDEKIKNLRSDFTRDLKMKMDNETDSDEDEI